MMTLQRLVSIGFVGLFLFLIVTSGLAISNSPTAVSNHPQPVRAPMAMQAPVQTTPAAPGGITATTAHPLPQPVPVPPAAAATVAAPTQAEAAPVSLLLPLLVVSMAGLMIGLVMVLVTNQRKVYGRFSHPSILTPGVQS